MKKEKTSLEKSHSKLSNFKLTLILILGTIFASLLWVGIVLLKANQALGIALASIGFLVSLLSLVLIRKFVR